MDDGEMDYGEMDGEMDDMDQVDIQAEYNIRQN